MSSSHPPRPPPNRPFPAPVSFPVLPPFFFSPSRPPASFVPVTQVPSIRCCAFSINESRRGQMPAWTRSPISPSAAFGLPVTPIPLVVPPDLLPMTSVYRTASRRLLRAPLVIPPHSSPLHPESRFSNPISQISKHQLHPAADFRGRRADVADMYTTPYSGNTTSYSIQVADQCQHPYTGPRARGGVHRKENALRRHLLTRICRCVGFGLASLSFVVMSLLMLTYTHVVLAALPGPIAVHAWGSATPSPASLAPSTACTRTWVGRRAGCCPPARGLSFPLPVSCAYYDRPGVARQILQAQSL